MNITVYLPDDLAQRAKADPTLKMSRVLRDALVQEFAEQDARATTSGKAKAYVLVLEDKEGRPYRGRLTGTLLTDSADVEVYLRDDDHVVMYDPSKLDYWVVEDPEEDLREQLSTDDYLAVMEAIGIVPTVDLP